MRSGVIAVCLLATCAVPAAAQQRQLGIKLGPTFPAVAVEDDDGGDAEYKRRFAVTFGGFVVIPLNDRVSAQIEALFSPKGGKATSDLQEGSLKLKLDYAEVPVLARLALTRTSGRSFYVFGGPAIAIRTGAKVESSINSDGFTIGDSIDVGVDYKRFDIGLVAGVGMDIGQWLVIDGRYNWGLIDVNRNPDVTVTVRNRVLSFMGGVRF
jgi:hypothetical protein